MFKYAKITNAETKQCEVGLGTNSKFYESIGMIKMAVEQAYDGSWYLAGYAPQPPEPTIEEQNEAIRQTRQRLFTEQADPLKFDYEECLARYGETDERTVEAKKVWLAKKDEIRENNPYISEPTETATSEVLDDSESTGLSWKNE